MFFYNTIFMQRGGYSYILTNKNNTVFYVGVTSDLYSRVIEHRGKIYPSSFTAKYNRNKQVWFEGFKSIEEAIVKEKYLKGKSRLFKKELIVIMNPLWIDLWNEDID